MKLRDIIQENVYTVCKKVYIPHDSWGDDRTETRQEFVTYAIGKPEDIQSYFEIKTGKEIVVTKLNLKYDNKVIKITPEIGENSRRLNEKKKSLEEELSNISKP